MRVEIIYTVKDDSENYDWSKMGKIGDLPAARRDLRFEVRNNYLAGIVYPDLPGIESKGGLTLVANLLGKLGEKIDIGTIYPENFNPNNTSETKPVKYVQIVFPKAA